MTLKRKEIILFLIFGLGVFLITFHFTDTPEVWIDEGVFTEVARNFALHGVLGIQVDNGKFFPMDEFLTTSYPVLLPVAGSIRIFGIGIWQSRLPMILFMFALVLLTYLYMEKRYGFRVAVLSVLMLISFSPFYGNGRPVLGEVPGLVYLVLGCLFLLIWERGDYHSKKFALLAGLVFGLSAATKPLYLAILTASLLASFLLLQNKIKFKNTLSLFTIGFFIPLFAWFFIHIPENKSISEIVSGYLYLSSNHESDLSVFRAVLVNLHRFYTESTPILFALLLAVIVVSFWRRFRKYKRDDFTISEFIVFFFIILNWLTYLKGTGHYRYFFPAQVLLYLLFPAAVLSLGEDVKDKIRLSRKIALAIPAILIIFQFVHLIFFSQTSLIVKRTRTFELSAVLSGINPSEKIFFDMSPEAVIFLKNENYSQHLSMLGLVNAGNSNAFTDSSLSYILSRRDFQAEFKLSCFTKKMVDRYFFLEKIKNCNKTSKNQ